MNNYLTSIFWGPADHRQFTQGLQQAVNQLEPAGIFAGDNLFTFGRQLSFLGDLAFMASVNKNARTAIEKAIIWRTYIVCWAARQGLRLDGDFIECGCYKGTTARIVCDYLDFARVGKKYHLHDLFIHTPDLEHPYPDHGPELYPQVKERFADLPNVNVIQGKLPDVLHGSIPERISFLHIDLNSAAAEVGCLELLFDRLVPGAILILDDYGWYYGIYRAQKPAEDRFFHPRGYQVLELPTGQGMVIK
jgi:hypothetical protein